MSNGQKARVGLLASVLTAGVCLAGNVCTWTGAAGDGKLQTAENWDVAPVSGNGDTLVVDADAALVNDTADFSIAALQLLGSAHRVTLNGQCLLFAIGNEAVVWTNEAMVVVNAPLAITANKSKNAKSFFCNSATFNDAVTMRTSSYLQLIGARGTTYSVIFNGPLSSGNRIEVASTTKCTFWINGPVSAPTVYTSSLTQSPGNVHFGGAMTCTRFNVCYSSFYLDADNILSPSGFLDWVGWYTGGCLDLMGHDQSVDYLAGEFWYSTNNPRYPSDTGRVLSSTGPATLTFSPSVSTTTYARVTGNLSLTMAAQDASKVQTFSSRTNSTDGTIFVSKGTFRVDGKGMFANVPELRVGGVGAVFEVAEDNGIVNPLPALLILRVAEGGKLRLPAGVALSVPRVFVGGQLQDVGAVFTGAGTAGTVVDWIEGAGTVTVCAASGVTYWKGGTGDWAEAGNWLGGVPSAGTAAFVTGLLDDTELRVMADAPMATNLTIACGAGVQAALSVNALLPFVGAWLDLGPGSQVTIGNGGCFKFDGSPAAGATASSTRFAIRDGAAVTVNAGGRMVVTNLTGKMVLGNAADQGNAASITVNEGGELWVADNSAGSIFAVAKDGTLSVAGDCYAWRMSNHENSFSLDGGTLNVSGNGRFLSFSTNNALKGDLLLRGNANFSGNAIFSLGDNYSWRNNINIMPQADGSSTTVSFTDNASISNFYTHLSIGGSTPGTACLDMSHATVGFVPPPEKESNGYDVLVGYNAATGRFDFAGAKLYVDHYSLRVAQGGDGKATACGAGYMTAMGDAAITVSAYGACARSASGGSATPLSTFYGIIVGDWLRAPATIADRPEYGRLSLVDRAKIVSRHGHFVLGAGRAEGVFTMADDTALELNLKDSLKYTNKNPDNSEFYSYATNSVMAVGMLGGLGRCIISNGAFTCNLRSFIGGCHTNEYLDGAYIKYGPDACNAENANAEGYLCVRGGSFTTTKPMVLGSHGTGELEIGPAGTFAGTTVVLSNAVASTLRFTLDGTGYTGSAQVARLVVTPEAKLVVDLANFVGKSRTIPLMTYAAREGDFAPANILLTADASNTQLKKAQLDVTSTGIYLRFPSGTALLLR